MIRGLVVIAIAGFLMSVVCLSAAIAIGGPEVMARGFWMWPPGWSHGRAHMIWRNAEAGPQSQRDFPWSGDSLAVDAPAEIDYVQAAGPPKLTIRGPAGLLDRVRVEGGRIVLADAGGDWSLLRVSLTAPAVSRFQLNGADTLRVSGYDQDHLTVVVSGHGQVNVQGQAKTVDLEISGAGEADLSQLKTSGATVDISGAASATLGPTDWARLDISGLGEVNLLSRPAHLETHVSGAGRIRQPGQDSVTAGDDEDRDRGPQRPT